MENGKEGARQRAKGSEPENKNESELVVAPDISLFRFADRTSTLI